VKSLTIDECSNKFKTVLQYLAMTVHIKQQFFAGKFQRGNFSTDDMQRSGDLLIVTEETMNKV